MTYKEYKSLTNIISTLLITGIYAIIIYQRYINGAFDSMDIFRFWAVAILLFIPISIITKIMILIIFNIINAVVQTSKGEQPEDDVVDERDKMIELRVTKISMIIFSLGFILALATQLTSMSNHAFFITLIIFGVISDVASDSMGIYYYRKGL